MNKIPLTIKELKSNTEFNYDVYTKEALISTIVSVRDYFSDLEKENQQLKWQLEMSKNNQKQASDSCRQHRLASKNHIRRLERREKQILRLEEKLEASEKARKEAIKYCNEFIKNVESLNLKIYPKEFYELINILDIDKGE